MGIKTFFKNIKYLSKVNLKDIAKIHDDMNAMIDNVIYELPEHLNLVVKPKIKNFEQTIDALVEFKPSFCRFGDGELNIINGKSIRFQKADPKLAQRLQDILTSMNDNIFIGINYHYYYFEEAENILDFSKHLHRVCGNYLRSVQGPYLRPGKQYYAAGFTTAYTTYKHYDFERYFDKMQMIWRDKKVTIICGDRVFNHIDYNIFDSASEVNYIYAPSMNAFDQYDKILESAKKIDKDHLVFIILGPTAKVLAYDLALEGYQALDLGHVAKDYDSYKKNTVNTKEHVIKFFLPD